MQAFANCTPHGYATRKNICHQSHPTVIFQRIVLLVVLLFARAIIKATILGCTCGVRAISIVEGVKRSEIQHIMDFSFLIFLMAFRAMISIWSIFSPMIRAVHLYCTPLGIIFELIGLNHEYVQVIFSAKEFWLDSTKFYELQKIQNHPP